MLRALLALLPSLRGIMSSHTPTVDEARATLGVAPGACELLPVSLGAALEY